MTLVKVCGLTRGEDVDAAVAAGAWAGRLRRLREPAPGLALAARASSPRASRRGVLSVAVFTREKPFEIATIVEPQRRQRRAALGRHLRAQRRRGAGGDERRRRPRRGAHRRPRHARRREGRLHPARLARDPRRLAGLRRHRPHARLEGHRRTPAQRLPRPDRLVLAGGLNPGNVRPAIRALRPLAVDVSSGLEKSPGVKDPEKIAPLLRRRALGRRGGDD